MPPHNPIPPISLLMPPHNNPIPPISLLSSRRYGMAAMLVNNGGVDMAHIKVTSHVAIYQTRRARTKKLRRQLQGVDTNDPACTAAGCPPGYQGTLCQFILV